MTQTIISALLWFSVMGCGLVAGLYFAFSAFIMTSLGRIDQSAGIAAMNAINEDILKSAFMLIFLGTTLAAAILAALALVRWGAPGSLLMLAGGVIYVVGMFVVTMVLNVPLNNALAAVDLSGPDAAPLWATYLKDWTFWNHVRMFASVGASVLFTLALIAK